MARPPASTTKEYREAVAKIIRDVQAAHGLSDVDFAEIVGCSLGTVRNARNEQSDLCTLFLTRIERHFGAGSIDPVLALGGSRAVPIDAGEECDALPSTAAAVHRIAVARSPSSPGGERITHQELLDIEPEIDAAIRALSALKVRCSQVRAA